MLACTYCNSIKKDKKIDASNLGDYFWADTDNTFRGFFYAKDRAPQINTSLPIAHQKISRNTLELTGLDREPLHPLLTKKDRRWEKRHEAWAKAERANVNLGAQPTDAMRDQIIDTATSTGFWSVWMTVFQNDSDMRRRLIQAFTGTSADCFDADFQPIPRQNGNC